MIQVPTLHFTEESPTLSEAREAVWKGGKAEGICSIRAKLSRQVVNPLLIPAEGACSSFSGWEMGLRTLKSLRPGRIATETNGFT